MASIQDDFDKYGITLFKNTKAYNKQDQLYNQYNISESGSQGIAGRAGEISEADAQNLISQGAKAYEYAGGSAQEIQQATGRAFSNASGSISIPDLVSKYKANETNNAAMAAERAKETGTVQVGNAMTIPNLQAQGQATLAGMQPNTPAAQANIPNLGTQNTSTAANAGVQQTLQPSGTQTTGAGTAGATTPNAGMIPVQVGNGIAYVPEGSAGAANMANIGTNNTSNELNAKYQAGLAQAQGSGAAIPSNGGDARSLVQSTMGTGGVNSSAIDLQLQNDPGYQQLLADKATYNSAANQTQSLTQEYQKLSSEAGLPAMNTELMNMKNIIDGTEDDIRTEVTKAGGFATDSQVLALAGARNKQLIKNYNNLLETKNQAMENINTMIGLSEKDRAFAMDKASQALQIDQQIIDYQQKMQTNAQNTYQNIINTVGYAGLAQMTQGNPYYTSLVEKTLGLGAGGLQQLATYKAPVDPMDALQLENQTLQNQKLKKELNAPTGGSKTLSVSEAQSLGVPYGTTEAQAKSMGITPGSVNGVDEKTMAKIQASPEYKTINGVLPAIQALSAYKEAINKYGGYEGMFGSGQGSGELSGTYGNAIAAWKTLAGLGALSGADFSLAENAVPSTGFFQKNSTMLSKINASIDNAISQATNLTQRLGQNYPTAKENLNTQLDFAKVIAYPDKYKVAPDGSVIEITN